MLPFLFYFSLKFTILVSYFSLLNRKIMKTRIRLLPSVLLSAGILLGLAMSSCDKVKELAEFDISYNNPDIRFTIDSLDYLPKSERLLVQQTLSVNIDSIIQKHELEGIKNASFEQVRLEVESPPQVNFNWLNSARVTVSATGLTETQIAATGAFSPDGRAVDLELSNLQVLSFISAGPFTLRVYGDINPPLPANLIVLLLKTKIKMTVQPV